MDGSLYGLDDTGAPVRERISMQELVKLTPFRHKNHVYLGRKTSALHVFDEGRQELLRTFADANASVLAGARPDVEVCERAGCVLVPSVRSNHPMNTLSCQGGGTTPHWARRI